jgi:hypothetical protein
MYRMGARTRIQLTFKFGSQNLAMDNKKAPIFKIEALLILNLMH